LWALFLLAVPVIIHLFNFRRYQTIYFSKVDLLNEAIEDSKSGNKLKHLLVLLSRLLAITALVFAFAQPYLSTNEQKNTQTISSIYIDNSFSMQAQGKDGNLLNEAKNKAIELVSSFEENEKVNLLTSDLLAKDQRFYTKADIIERIKEIDFSPIATTLESATNLQVDLLNQTLETADKRLFVFSDFQKSTGSVGNLADSSITPFIYQPIAEIKGNIFIDSVWFNAPNQTINSPSELLFRLKNLTDQRIDNLTITLSIDGREKGIKTITLDPQSTSVEQISYAHANAGVKKGKLSIKTNQLFFDDTFYFTYTIKNETKILIINNEISTNTSFAQLYGVDPFYEHTSVNISKLKQEDFNDKALIVLNGINTLTSGAINLVDKSLKTGATVVLIPGSTANLSSWNTFLKAKNLPTFGAVSVSNSTLKYFNDSDPIYTGVFDQKPDRYKKTIVTKQYPIISHQKHNFISLFGTRENKPFLLYSKLENSGRIFMQASPLMADWTDFNKQALFAATYLRIAETASFEKKLFYTIGNTETYLLQNSLDEKAPIHLLNKALQFDLIPLTNVTPAGQSLLFDRSNGVIKQAAFYELSNLTDFSDVIAFNYDRAESLTDCFTSKEVLSLFTEQNWPPINQLKIDKKGQLSIDTIKPIEYWRLCLYLALLFLAIEMALLKWWKTS
ncbi:MAG: BatA and WFA domain-containing protein, partial [Putridiphycobacter sp.]|nr:BatA and WFA domain-containing protein [Putridiphycobacter sp.]